MFPTATGQLSAVLCIGRTELLYKNKSLPERLSYKTPICDESSGTAETDFPT